VANTLDVEVLLMDGTVADSFSIPLQGQQPFPVILVVVLIAGVAVVVIVIVLFIRKKY